MKLRERLATQPAMEAPRMELRGSDTPEQASHAYQQMKSRVHQLLGKSAWAENPPSRTRRLISNVRIRERAGDTIRVTANFVVYRMRFELVDTYVGRYEYTLVWRDGALKIQHRRAILDLEALRPHGKVSIIL